MQVSPALSLKRWSFGFGEEKINYLLFIYSCTFVFHLWPEDLESNLYYFSTVIQLYLQTNNIYLVILRVIETYSTSRMGTGICETSSMFLDAKQIKCVLLIQGLGCITLLFAETDWLNPSKESAAATVKLLPHIAPAVHSVISTITPLKIKQARANNCGVTKTKWIISTARSPIWPNKGMATDWTLCHFTGDQTGIWVIVCRGHTSIIWLIWDVHNSNNQW